MRGRPRQPVGILALVTMAIAMSAGPMGSVLAQDCHWPLWRAVGADPDAARSQHAMCYDPIRGRVMMFGGRSSSNQVLGDTLVWDGSSWVSLGVPGPGARAQHAMAFDPVRKRVVLTGGVNGAGQPILDTWEWNGARWTLVSTAAPRSEGPTLVVDPVGERLLLVDRTGDLWAWAGGAWTLVDDGGLPGGRHAAGFDRGRGVLVVMSFPSFTHEWTPGQGWRRVSESSFPYSGLYGQSMFYSTVKSCVMSVAGNDGAGFGTNYRAGTFGLVDGEWSTWGSMTLFGPAGLRNVDAAVAELPDGSVLLFGGRTSTPTGNMWRLGFEPSPGEPIFFWRHPSVSGNAVPFGTMTIWAVTNDASDWVGSVDDLGVAYQWRRGGQPLTNGVAPSGVVISGATSLEMRLTGVRLADAGVYDVVATHCAGSVIGNPVAVGIACRANLTTTASPWLAGYGVPDLVLNSEDFFYYVRAYSEGNTWVADLTTSGAASPGQAGYLVPDGVLTSDDFFVYLGLFAQGC